MKEYLCFFFTILAVCVASTVSEADMAQDALITSIEYLGEQEGGELVQIKLSETRNPHFLRLPGESQRLVFDFPATTYSRRNPFSYTLNGRLIKRVRVGVHRDPEKKIRLVLDMQGNESYRVRQEYDISNQVYNILVFPQKVLVRKPIDVTVVKKKQHKVMSESELLPQTPADRVDSPIIEQDKGGMTTRVEVKDRQPSDGGTEENPGEIDEVSGDTADISVELKETVPLEESPRLVKVSFERSTNDKEMVLFRLSGFHPPVVFSMEEEQLLVVCDFLDVTLEPGMKKRLKSNGKYIRGVKLTIHQEPQKVRAVLELKDSFNYDLKQVFFREDNLFVIIVSKVDQQG